MTSYNTVDSYRLNRPLFGVSNNAPYSVSVKVKINIKPPFPQLKLLTNANTPSDDANSSSNIGSNNEYRFSQCVSHIRVLSLRLRQSENRCQQLTEDLESVRIRGDDQVCLNDVADIRAPKHSKYATLASTYKAHLF